MSPPGTILDSIRQAFASRRINITRHAAGRMREEHLLLADVERAVGSGEVVEDYVDGKPFPSCLIFGRDPRDDAVHAVVAYDAAAGYAVPVTAYRPACAAEARRFGVAKARSSPMGRVPDPKEADMTGFVRTCVRCSGEVIEREMDELVRDANSVVMVAVHGGVCRKCGEGYFAPETVELFEKIRRKLAAGDVAGFTPVGQAYRA